MFSLEEIEFIKSQKTPFYYYNLEALAENLDALKRQADKHRVNIHYALKANNNKPILEMLRFFGLGADCVSGAEIQRALETGFNPANIVFAGVGKTDQEINYGLLNRIGCFNCESIQELRVIDSLAAEMDVLAPVALRINPDFDCHSHKNITTGTRSDKFGISKSDIPEVLSVLSNLSHVCFKGLHFHIGSQISDMGVFMTFAEEINSIQDRFISGGFFPGSINFGGGLGVDYENPEAHPIPDYSMYFMAYLNSFKRFPNQEIHFEPGRSVVAHCGSLISSVLFLKKGEGFSYAIIDAGMNDLIRPALYQANHKIQKLYGNEPEETYHIAGPICESSDVFAKNIPLPQLKRGDLLAIRSAGAYGESMASAYNLRQRAQAVYFPFNKLKTPQINYPRHTQAVLYPS